MTLSDPGLDGEHHTALVGERPAQDDEAGSDERVHEDGVRAPSGLLLHGSRRIPPRAGTVRARRGTSPRSAIYRARSRPLPAHAQVTVSLGCWVLLPSLEKYRAPSLTTCWSSRKLTTPSPVTADVTPSVYVVPAVTAPSDAIVAAFAAGALAHVTVPSDQRGADGRVQIAALGRRVRARSAHREAQASRWRSCNRRSPR